MSDAIDATTVYTAGRAVTTPRRSPQTLPPQTLPPQTLPSQAASPQAAAPLPLQYKAFRGTAELAVSRAQGTDAPLRGVVSKKLTAQHVAFQGTCYHCGYASHSQRFCPLRWCRACKAYGHSEAACARTVLLRGAPLAAPARRPVAPPPESAPVAHAGGMDGVRVAGVARAGEPRAGEAYRPPRLRSAAAAAAAAAADGDSDAELEWD